MASLSLTKFSLFFSDILFSDPAAIRIQTTFFLLSCCCCRRPQDRNCGRKTALMKHCRPAGWHHGNQDLPMSGRAGSPGLPLLPFQHLPRPVSQNLSAHRGHAPHFALFLFSLLLLFPSSSLCTWLIYSLSQGAPHVLAAGTGPLKTKADFCRSHPCLGLSLQEGTFLLFLAFPLLLAWLGPCPLGRAEARFSGGWRVGRWL